MLRHQRRIHHPRLHHNAVEQRRPHQVVAHRTHEPQVPSRCPTSPRASTESPPRTPSSPARSPSPAYGSPLRRSRGCSHCAHTGWSASASSRPCRPRRYTPSRSPTHTSPCPSTDSAATCVTFAGSATACHVLPPSADTSQLRSGSPPPRSPSPPPQSAIARRESHATTLHVSPLDVLRSTPSRRRRKQRVARQRKAIHAPIEVLQRRCRHCALRLRRLRSRLLSFAPASCRPLATVPLFSTATGASAAFASSSHALPDRSPSAGKSHAPYPPESCRPVPGPG